MNPISKPSAPVCIITGGTSGIGLATASEFASAGYRVAICGRDEERLHAAAKTIKNAATGDEFVFAASADVADPRELRSFLGEVLNQFGRCDVLVNNAAIAPLHSVAEMPLDDVRRMLDVNVLGIVVAVQAVWPTMVRQKAGTIISISSLAAVDPFAGLELYGCSKAWVEAFTRGAAREGRPVGIRVFAIRPGAVETPMLRKLFADFPPEDCVQPHQLAQLALRLCGAEFSDCTGQVIEIKR